MLAQFIGFAVVVEEAAVVGVFLILADHAGGEGGGEVWVELLADVGFHEGSQGVLVFFGFIEDFVNEEVSLIVVIEGAFGMVLHVVADELLEDLEAFDDGLVAVAQVGIDEVLVFEPPKVGVPIGIDIVGRFGFTVVVGHAVEEEIEHGGFVFDVGAVFVLEETEIVLGLGVL